ncbi:MAG: nitronate monooxygenase, partial [Acidimicrobiales bacterium]
PLGGGPTTPALVTAATEAGALGVLAGAYKTAAEMTAEIEQVRACTVEPFGVNVFVPGAPTEHPEELRQYLDSLRGDADMLGAELGEPAFGDDDWAAKLGALLAGAPPLVSFTFGCPPREVAEALSAKGVVVAVTVTSAEEARTAAEAGAGLLCVQGSEAGAHRGCFRNDLVAGEGTELIELLAAVSAVTRLPLIGAGGIMTAGGVKEVLGAGAVAAQCGTAFLRCDESGAHPTHKDALASGRFRATAVTRAFSGRPARGLANRFVTDHPGAPPAYPEINSATRPLRAAAAASADVEHMSLWAGTGFAEARSGPAGEIVELLTPRR